MLSYFVFVHLWNDRFYAKATLKWRLSVYWFPLVKVMTFLTFMTQLQTSIKFQKFVIDSGHPVILIGFKNGPIIQLSGFELWKWPCLNERWTRLFFIFCHFWWCALHFEKSSKMKKTSIYFFDADFMTTYVVISRWYLNLGQHFGRKWGKL